MLGFLSKLDNCFWVSSTPPLMLLQHACLPEQRIVQKSTRHQLHRPLSFALCICRSGRVGGRAREGSCNSVCDG